MDTTMFHILMFGACLGLGSACSCIPSNGPQKFCRFDLIFRGTALAEYEERDEPADYTDPFDDFYPYKDWVYSVSVDEAIVMPSNLTKATTIQLRTPVMGSLCGTRFPLDVPFIFFAFIDHEGKIHTGLCDYNSPWVSLDPWQQELMTDHIADFCATEGNNPVSVPGLATPPEP